MRPIDFAVDFGDLPDGRATRLWALSNDQMRVTITDYGARLVSIETPDRNGVRGHVLLGFDNAAAYATAGGSFGAILGRYANRIRGGRFRLDNQEYQLDANDQGNTLHGGTEGFGSKLWHTTQFRGGAAPELALTFSSPDGDQGFPGTLTVNALYRLESNQLKIELSATTDAPTPVNLSAHPYFNLSGLPGTDIQSHEIMIRAARFLPTDAKQIPTGCYQEVADTAFDFRQTQGLAGRLWQDDPQLLIGRGFDHCFILDDQGRSAPNLAASACDPASGRCLEVRTTQPGLQFYAGNSLDGSLVGRFGRSLRQSAGFAFEAQGFPDAPNQPGFPDSILRPGQTYRQEIDYRFFAV